MIEAFPLLEGRPYGGPVAMDLGPSDDAHVFERALSEAEDAVDAGSAPEIAATPLQGISSFLAQMADLATVHETESFVAVPPTLEWPNLLVANDPAFVPVQTAELPTAGLSDIQAIIDDVSAIEEVPLQLDASAALPVESPALPDIRAASADLAGWVSHPLGLHPQNAGEGDAGAAAAATRMPPELPQKGLMNDPSLLGSSGLISDPQTGQRSSEIAVADQTLQTPAGQRALMDLGGQGSDIPALDAVAKPPLTATQINLAAENSALAKVASPLPATGPGHWAQGALQGNGPEVALAVDQVREGAGTNGQAAVAALISAKPLNIWSPAASGVLGGRLRFETLNDHVLNSDTDEPDAAPQDAGETQASVLPAEPTVPPPGNAPPILTSGFDPMGWDSPAPGETGQSDMTQPATLQNDPALTGPDLGPSSARGQAELTKTTAQVIVSHAEDRAEVLLEPAELGRLRFEINQRGDGVQIVLMAERPETLELLRRNADQLLSDLKSMGFSGSELGFGSWGQESRQNEALVFDDSGGDEPAPLPPQPFGAAPLPRTATGGLDLRL